ncbi:MAG: hypothetical protein OXR73_09760 [Myxococcales bacterium]|nr:hypothetical protein [Myxococcales bacterium]
MRPCWRQQLRPGLRTVHGKWIVGLVDGARSEYLNRLERAGPQHRLALSLFEAVGAPECTCHPFC